MFFSRSKEGIVSFQVTFIGEKGRSLSCRLLLLPQGKGAGLPWQICLIGADKKAPKWLIKVTFLGKGKLQLDWVLN